MAEAAKKEEVEKEGEEEGGAEGNPGNKKKKLFLFIGIGVFLAAGIGGGLFFFLSGGEKEGGEVATEEHGETPAEGHGEKPAEGHGEKAAEGGHGEKPAEGHGEKAAEGDHGEKPAEGHGEKAEGGKPATLPDFGETFALKSFNLNLGNPLENRYVRLEVTIEYAGGGDQKKELEARIPQLRDAVISVVTRKTREFLLAPDGKEQLRKEILTRINRYMTKPVKSIYITDLLIE